MKSVLNNGTKGLVILMPDGMHLMIPAEEYVEMEAKIERLEKALDKACDLISEAVNQDCSIFDEVIKENYLWRTERHEWKEWCLKDENS